MISSVKIGVYFFVFAFLVSCKPDDTEINYGDLQLSKVSMGDKNLLLNERTTGIETTKELSLTFSSPIDTNTLAGAIQLFDQQNNPLELHFTYAENQTLIFAKPDQSLQYKEIYQLNINKTLQGVNKERFAGAMLEFETENGVLRIENIILNNTNFSETNHLKNIPFEDNTIEVVFNFPLDPTNYKSNLALIGYSGLETILTNQNKTILINIPGPLESIKKYYFTISSSLTALEGYPFGGFNNYFYTAIDSTPKFPLLTDDELLTLVQQQTFKYFWDYAHPVSGLARERLGSGDVVTTGGSGFGLMALIVGTERGFISRTQLLERVTTIVSFLETSDRFHGVWPHWMNGTTGKAIAFSTYDNGGDLVETSFMIQGLLILRQYLNPTFSEEAGLINRINELWQAVEWDWFTREQNVLYWHWSPTYEWEMNMQIRGWSECLITYVLAASSTTHTISSAVYDEGWARNGAFPMTNGKSFYGITLPLSWDYGGPLFWAHYSFLGLDPRNLSDKYASYWEQNQAHALIHYEYSKANPKNYLTYSADCWGLTACDVPNGYAANEPANDRGVIAPTAALASMPYAPEASMDALRFYYYILGNKLWGAYGFYDAFDANNNWWASSYLAIDQGPIICMIENHRSALLWNLFMSAPEIQQGLTKLGFNY